MMAALFESGGGVRPHTHRNDLDRFVDPNPCDPSLLARKRALDELMHESPSKKRKSNDESSDGEERKEEHSHPKENIGFHLSPLLNRSDCETSSSEALLEEHHYQDQSMKGDSTLAARKFGRVTGAKGYSLQEIQLLFALIREKVLLFYLIFSHRLYIFSFSHHFCPFFKLLFLMSASNRQL
jgi:hypothetical protein